MTHRAKYIELRKRRGEIDDEIANLELERDKIKDEMYDMECLDLTSRDMRYLRRCDAMGIEP